MSDEASSLSGGRGEPAHGQAGGKPPPQQTHGLKEANLKGLFKQGLQRVHTRIVLPERGCHVASASFLWTVVTDSCEKLLREASRPRRRSNTEQKRYAPPPANCSSSPSISNRGPRASRTPPSERTMPNWRRD